MEKLLSDRMADNPHFTAGNPQYSNLNEAVKEQIAEHADAVLDDFMWWIMAKYKNQMEDLYRQYKNDQEAQNHFSEMFNNM